MEGEHRLVGIKFTRSIREVQIMASFTNYEKRMASTENSVKSMTYEGQTPVQHCGVDICFPSGSSVDTVSMADIYTGSGCERALFVMLQVERVVSTHR